MPHFFSTDFSRFITSSAFVLKNWKYIPNFCPMLIKFLIPLILGCTLNECIAISVESRCIYTQNATEKRYMTGIITNIRRHFWRKLIFYLCLFRVFLERRCQSMANDLEAKNDLCKLDFELTVRHKSQVLCSPVSANCLQYNANAPQQFQCLNWFKYQQRISLETKNCSVMKKIPSVGW